MDGTFVIEQFGYEFKVGHILQVPALFHLLCKEAYGTGYQSDYSGGESDLHIVSHGSNISAGQSARAGPIGINVPIRPKIGPSLVRVLEMAKSLSAAISKLANKRCTCAGVSRASNT